MKLNEVTSLFEMHKVIEYASDGNKVVRHNRPIRKLKEPFYCGEITGDEYSRGARIYVLYPELNIAMYLGGSGDTNDVDYILEQCKKMNMGTTAQFMETLDQIAAENGFIKTLYIEVAAMFCPEKVQTYIQSKQNYEAEYNRQRKAEQERREAENQEYVNKQNREAEKTVREAIEIINSGGVLQNISVEFYRSRYDSSAYSIVNYLMRKYGINIPIRTQGWINDRLVAVNTANNSVQYRKVKNGKCSDVFFDYLEKLIAAVKAEDENV